MRNEMRQHAYREISKTLYSLTSILRYSENKQRDFILLRNDILSFSKTMNHLFDTVELEEITNSLDKSLKDLSESSFIKKNITFNSNNFESNEFELLYKAFDNNRSQLITLLQNLIIC
jgi:hypothetical protein